MLLERAFATGEVAIGLVTQSIGLPFLIEKSRRVDKQSASTFGGGDGGCAIAYPPYGLGSGAVRQMRSLG